jgi:hypothetical protein
MKKQTTVCQNELSLHTGRRIRIDENNGQHKQEAGNGLSLLSRANNKNTQATNNNNNNSSKMRAFRPPLCSVTIELGEWMLVG